MFHKAKAFNSDLSDWDVSEATTLWGMFYDAESFNQDLSKWITTLDWGEGFSMAYMLDQSGCDIKDDPLEFTYLGVIADPYVDGYGYFCSYDMAPIEPSTFMDQAENAATLCKTTYFESGIDTDKIDGFSAENVAFNDLGSGNAYDTVIVARDK